MLGASQASRDEAVTGRGFCVKEDGASSRARGQSSSFHLTSSLLFHSPHSVAAAAAVAAAASCCCCCAAPLLLYSRPFSSDRTEPKRSLPLQTHFTLPLTTHYATLLSPLSSAWPASAHQPHLTPGPCRTLFPPPLSPLCPLEQSPLTPRPRCCSPSEAPATTYASAHKRSRSPLAVGALALSQCSHHQQPICKDPGCHRVRLDCHRYDFSSYPPRKLRPLIPSSI